MILERFFRNINFRRENPKGLEFAQKVDSLILKEKFDEALEYVEANYDSVEGLLSKDLEATLAEKLEYAEMVRTAKK